MFSDSTCATLLCMLGLIVLIAAIVCATRQKNTSSFDECAERFAVYYINIDRRTDRNAHFLSEMQKIQSDAVVRVPAVEHNIGTLGCIQSHIKALKMCLHDNNEFALICEDDFTFKTNIGDVHHLLQEALRTCLRWNVILLAVNGRTEPTRFKDLHKVVESQTASAYLIKKSYVSVVLSLWEDTYAKTMHLNEIPPYDLHMDICWKILQHDKWYAVHPAMGYQYKSYSDIQKGVVDYGV